MNEENNEVAFLEQKQVNAKLQLLFQKLYHMKSIFYCSTIPSAAYLSMTLKNLGQYAFGLSTVKKWHDISKTTEIIDNIEKLIKDVI